MIISQLNADKDFYLVSGVIESNKDGGQPGTWRGSRNSVWGTAENPIFISPQIKHSRVRIVRRVPVDPENKVRTTVGDPKRGAGGFNVTG